MFGWLSNLFFSKPSRPTCGRAVRLVRARYDAAATNADNRRHWANAAEPFEPIDLEERALLTMPAAGR